MAECPDSLWSAGLCPGAKSVTGHTLIKHQTHQPPTLHISYKYSNNGYIADKLGSEFTSRGILQSSKQMHHNE